MLKLTSHNEAATREIGRWIGTLVREGTVIALNGELGAGKTVLAKGIAEGLAVKDDVISPSYVIMNVYRGRLYLYHFDFYRLEEEDELLELGLEEYFYGDGVALVEWAGKFPGVLPFDRLEIELQKNQADPEHSRILYIKSRGNMSVFNLEELKKLCCF